MSKDEFETDPGDQEEPLPEEPEGSDGYPDEADGELVDPEQSWTSTALLGAAISIGVFGLVYGMMSVQLSSPLRGLPVFPVAASKASYSMTDLTESNLGSMMIESKREEAERRQGIDFSLILMPYDLSESKAMQRVAAACLPRGRYKRWVMPTEAHGTFARATDYLVCAMDRDRERLCHSNDRQHLVDQLMQYRKLREQLFAIERIREEMQESEGGQRVMRMEKVMMDMQGADSASRPVVNSPKIDDDLDPRIAERLTELNREGYLSISDFRWMGFFAPIEYAPYLDGDGNDDACG